MVLQIYAVHFFILINCLTMSSAKARQKSESEDNNMLDFIKSRRSTRKYKQTPVPQDLVEQVVQAGRYAPSGGNCQSTHFIVLQDEAVLEELAKLVRQEFSKMEVSPGMYRSIVNSINASRNGNYIFHYHAPVLIITANQNDYGNNIADCSCALENMMLMANALDLGSCWINQLKWLNENPVILQYLKELGMHDRERVYGALALGYADTEDGLPDRTPLPRTGNEVTYVEKQ